MTATGEPPIGPVEARWQPLHGERGEKGERGQRGEQGMPARTRYALVFLFILAMAVGIIGIYGQARTDLKLNSAVRTINEQQQELNRQAASSSRDRCTSIARIVAIPIPVPLKDNPSRQAWAAFEGVERARGRELGCVMPAPRFVHVAGKG